MKMDSLTCVPVDDTTIKEEVNELIHEYKVEHITPKGEVAGARYYTTTRGSKGIVYEGYKFNFHKQRKSGGRSYWRCREKQCRSFLTLQSGDDHDIPIVSKPHNHEVANCAREDIINELKVLIDIRPSLSIGKTYRMNMNKAVTQGDKKEVMNTPSLSSAKSSLYRYKHSKVPPVPKLRSGAMSSQVPCYYAT